MRDAEIRCIDPRPEGLCADCRHVRRVDSAGGPVYWRCVSAVADLGKYPKLPVIACRGHECEPSARYDE